MPSKHQLQLLIQLCWPLFHIYGWTCDWGLDFFPCCEPSSVLSLKGNTLLNRKRPHQTGSQTQLPSWQETRLNRGRTPSKWCNTAHFLLLQKQTWMPVCGAHAERSLWFSAESAHGFIEVSCDWHFHERGNPFKRGNLSAGKGWLMLPSFSPFLHPCLLISTLYHFCPKLFSDFRYRTNRISWYSPTVCLKKPGLGIPDRFRSSRISVMTHFTIWSDFNSLF